MSKVIEDQFGSSLESKIVVIENWDDGSMIRPVPRADHPLIREWGIEGDFVVLYAGNIGLFHELDTVIEAASILDGQKIKFVFVGDGLQVDYLCDQVDRRGLSNIIRYPFLPKEEMPSVLTACHVGLVTLKREATGLCVPSKLYGIMAAGRPVVAVLDAESQTALTIQRHDCGVVIEPGKAKDLAETLIALKDDSSQVSRLGANARGAFERHFTVERAVEQYKRALTDKLGCLSESCRLS